MALFHRAYLNRPDLIAADWLIQPQKLIPSYRRGAGIVREWLAPRLTAEELVTISAFDAQIEHWLRPVSGPKTLIHGDPRVDNILFDGPERRACLIDWQSLSAGDPLYDVAYFLSGSVSIADRRAGERDLLHDYVGLMAEADAAFTYERAEASYRRCLPSGLWLTIIAAAFVDRSAHNAELIETLIHRNVEAMRDWDALAAI